MSNPLGGDCVFQTNTIECNPFGIFNCLSRGFSAVNHLKRIL